MENKISYDTMIDMVARESMRRELKSLPPLEELNKMYEETEEQKKKFEKLLKKRKRKDSYGKIYKTVSKVSVVALVCLCTVFTPILSAEVVQKSIIETVLEWKNGFTSIFVKGEKADDKSLYNVQIGYMLDGYYLKDEPVLIKDRAQFNFTDNNECTIIIRLSNVDEKYSVNIDNDYTDYYRIIIDDTEALWTIRDGYNVLTLVKDNLLYEIKGYIEINEMIEIYENIVV